ncbi:MAG: GHMP kinase [Candidatus Hydrogenedentes bacterium]|nr:GHMP kinase [Candidatus Hydrogenedentota bacterium]
MIVRCKAPLRISFAGGGTDVDPYRRERGGCVLSATIDKYAYASCKPRNDNTIQVHSLDFDIVARYDTRQEFVMDGELDLAKATIARLRGRKRAKGFDLFLHSDAPPGSGLGSSSSVVVALVTLFQDYFQQPMTPYEIAELAYTIERGDLALKGGMQDQYAAAFGGFNYIEFLPDNVIVNPLRLSPDTVNELQYNLLLCYTGKTRVSDGIIDTQVRNYTQRRKPSVDAMDALKTLTVDMKNAVLQGRLNTFGELLSEVWRQKRQMASRIATPRIEEMLAEGKKAGATGGKLLGAGGGGYLLFYTPAFKKHVVAERMTKMGGQPVEFKFEMQGSVSWRASS